MNSFFDNQNVTKQAKGIDIRTSGNNKDITKNKNYNKNKTYNWVTRALPDECYQQLKKIYIYLKYFCNNK